MKTKWNAAIEASCKMVSKILLTTARVSAGSISTYGMYEYKIPAAMHPKNG